jgi:hypothetical protein
VEVRLPSGKSTQAAPTIIKYHVTLATRVHFSYSFEVLVPSRRSPLTLSTLLYQTCNHMVVLHVIIHQHYLIHVLYVSSFAYTHNVPFLLNFLFIPVQ